MFAWQMPVSLELRYGFSLGLIVMITHFLDPRLDKGEQERRRGKGGTLDSQAEWLEGNNSTSNALFYGRNRRIRVF